MATAAKLDLKELVLSVVDSLPPGAQPRVVTEQIFARELLDEEDYEEALQVTFPAYVSQVTLNRRHARERAAKPDEDEEETTTTKPLARKGKTTAARSRRRRTKSDSTEEERFDALLANEYYDGERKLPLRDMEEDDIDNVISYYQRLAAENGARANQFVSLKKLLQRTRNATTVGDLPPEKVAAIFAPEE